MNQLGMQQQGQQFGIHRPVSAAAGPPPVAAVPPVPPMIGPIIDGVPIAGPLVFSSLPFMPIIDPLQSHASKNRGHHGFRGKKDRVRGRVVGARGIAGRVTGQPLHGILM